MIMLHRYLFAEILKLRRSLALMLCVAAPACVAVLGTVVAFDRKTPVPLDNFVVGGPGIWSFVMLPLAVTALSVLLAQMEHGSRNWNHLLTLPGARPNLFLAKAIVMLGLIAMMSALLWAFMLVGAALLTALHPVGVIGAVDTAQLAQILALMTVCSALVAMLQLWVALAYRSFVVPLVFGIGGTFVAISTIGAAKAAWFPWLLATDVLATRPEVRQTGLLLGGIGGLAVLGAMLAHLGRREA
ncbi:ABC transporter permease [uncultured Sphingomonas sp.]|uniref:ABC transporter permease n=1 Tax=uncultured Sphingomonas sp. TaxID=158754 RepID=UPI0025ED12C5|nr:ABC transporter permease [uncultured Sphingomonas sp.]